MRERGFGVVVLVAVGALAGACASREYNSPQAALADVTNRDLNYRTRTQAVPAALEGADGDARRAALRALEDVAWDPTEHATLRSAALRTLLEDPASAERVRARAADVLPRERSREVVLNLCTMAADRGWKELRPAIVQSFARPVKGVPDDERSELRALRALGGDAARTTFDLFVESAAASTTDPETGAAGNADARALRFRRDAWEVLSRLDASGEQRRRWVGELPPASAGDVEVLQRGLREWRVLPLTAEQLDWQASLASAPDAWSQGRAALEMFGDTPVSLRHASAAIWARTHAPDLAGLSRQELLDRLASRLRGRTQYGRSAETSDRRAPERLEQVRDRLSKADLVHVLAVDNAVRDPAVVHALFGHARLDQADESTEYGGLIAWEAGGPRAVLYQPRLAERAGDTTFVAPAEMLRAGDWSLAHYHFHVQNWRRSEYAGPSEADLAYCTRYGRACVVFTAIREGTLGVDYYQPGGVVVDLGTIELAGL
ncbi:MAG: hypothetical protein SFY69_01305 [Planctomycetota bacterium]|nr:hypothetical protein [Planctomycetota bacterium]